MEEGKKLWWVVYSPEDKIFEVNTSVAYREWGGAFQDSEGKWSVVVAADNKVDAMQLGLDKIEKAIMRQRVVLKEIAQSEIEKARAKQDPKWWDVCYSVHTQQYSVREAPFTLTGSQKDGEIDVDSGCYRIYVQAPDKKTACVEADFRFGQYILNIRQGMAMALRRTQQEYFFNDGNDTLMSMTD